MQRREDARGFKLLQNRCVDQAMLQQPGSAVNDAMPDCGRCGLVGV